MQSHGGDSAIINVNHNDDKLTEHSAPEINSLIDGTLGETHFTNEDLHQPLIPTTATLLQAIQGLSKVADCMGIVSRFKTGWLTHVDDLIISECSIQVRAFNVDLMEL